MPRLNGIQAAEKIRDHGLATRVVILSMHSDKSLVQQCMRLGVKGYVLKNSVRDELVMAIQAAARNATYLSPAVSDLVLNTLTGSEADETPDGYEQLTAREREILKLIAEGYTNKAIADTLHLSIKTIEKDRSRLIDKLETRDLAGLIRIAMKHGLVLPGEKPPSI
jgi:DNA-binding NarL/FixJ family response regulator